MLAPSLEIGTVCFFPKQDFLGEECHTRLSAYDIRPTTNRWCQASCHCSLQAGWLSATSRANSVEIEDKASTRRRSGSHGLNYNPAHHAARLVQRGMNGFGHKSAVLFKANGNTLTARSMITKAATGVASPSQTISGPYTNWHETVPCGSDTNFLGQGGQLVVRVLRQRRCSALAGDARHCPR
jgi:hypothetical protein